MNVYIFGVGAIVFLLGLGGVSGIVPLGIVNINSVSASCDVNFNCTATAVANSISGVNPVTVWWIVFNSIGQEVYFTSTAVTITQGSTNTYTATFSLNSATCNCAAGPGTYTIKAFAIDATGQASLSVSSSFSTYDRLIIFYTPGTSIAVNPPGANIQTCTSSCGGSYYSYSAWYPWGTSVSVTPTLGGQIQAACWEENPSGVYVNCNAITSGTAFSFLVNTNPYNYQAIYIVANPGATQISQIYIQTAPGAFTTITPPNAIVYATGTTSQSFSIGVGGGTAQWAPVSWSVSGTPFKGTNSSFVLTYSALSRYISNGGTATISTTASSTLPTLTIIAQSGATLTPSPGTYTEQPGQSVQVSETTSSGYNFCGWIVNGQNQGNANPITLTMPQSGPVSITPVMTVFACSGGQTGNTNTQTATTTSSSGGGNAGMAVGFVLVIGGGLTMAVGYRMRGRVEE